VIDDAGWAAGWANRTGNTGSVQLPDVQLAARRGREVRKSPRAAKPRGVKDGAPIGAFHHDAHPGWDRHWPAGSGPEDWFGSGSYPVVFDLSGWTCWDDLFWRFIIFVHS